MRVDTSVNATLTPSMKALLDDYRSKCAPLLDVIFNYVRSQIPVAQDAEDVTQDVFRKALQSWEQIRAGEPRAWLYTTARNAVAQYYRDRNVERKGMQTLKSKHERLQTHEPPADAVLETHQAYQAAQEAIAGLEPQEREAVRLKFSSALSNAEIAQTLKMTPNHLGVVLFRALKKVRSAMEEQGYGHA